MISDECRVERIGKISEGGNLKVPTSLVPLADDAFSLTRQRLIGTVSLDRTRHFQIATKSVGEFDLARSLALHLE